MPIKTDRPYHHGNLRDALIQEACQRVRKDGHETVSTRSCAKAVGVAPSAVFRHFATKKDLMTAVAVEGFTGMKDEVTKRQEEAGSHPMAQFRGLAEGYLSYALREPNLFRLMFRGEAIIRDHPDFVAASKTLGLSENLSRFGDPKTEVNILSWAVIHGLAMLAIDSQLDDNLDPDPDLRTMQLLPLIRHISPLFDRSNR